MDPQVRLLHFLEPVACVKNRFCSNCAGDFFSQSILSTIESGADISAVFSLAKCLLCTATESRRDALVMVDFSTLSVSSPGRAVAASAFGVDDMHPIF
jgi:hypothetical protein